MKCADYLQRLDAEPLSSDPALMAHRDQCAACAAAWQSQQTFERQLREALAVTVPAGLTQRLRETRHQHQRRTRTRRRFSFAIAASLLLALIAGGVILRQMDAHSLPAVAVAHMLHSGEIGAMARTQSLATQTIDVAFASREVDLKGRIPAHTTYVHQCMVGGKPAVHLVTRFDDQPVVVLYVPHMNSSADKAFERDGWRGREVALAGGELIVLSNRGKRPNFKAVAQAWRLAIDGPGAAQRISMLWEP